MLVCDRAQPIVQIDSVAASGKTKHTYRSLLAGVHNEIAIDLSSLRGREATIRIGNSIPESLAIFESPRLEILLGD